MPDTTAGTTTGGAVGPACTARIPGKLYLAGEYAVTVPGRAALVVAVDRFVTVRAQLTDSPRGRFTTAGAAPLVWRQHNNVPVIDSGGGDFWSHCIHAHRVVEAWRVHNGVPAATYDVTVTSDLVDKATGRKYGLGSSAAVTCAVIAAIAGVYGLPADPVTLYKLAMLATVMDSPATSGGDIAASSAGGYVHYRSPDRQWIARQRLVKPLHTRVAELVSARWPGLSITPVTAAGRLRILPGWTGSPAVTDTMLGTPARTPFPDSLLDRSDGLVETMAAMVAGQQPADGVGEVVAGLREVLSTVAAVRTTTIVTPRLAQLIDCAEQLGWSAKTSGAGGGDCGIAITPFPGATADKEHELGLQWEKAGISALPVVPPEKPALPQVTYHGHGPA
ncbi:phosphomevalonate kinase [Corynebacterium mendelii]|uniref:phosphomevalonate kinase n=1 Tax=Corynebacterium mendelii TaxID=2765362 RepID=A0A939IX19_9CORY|nr:phosphomevalonate kinase [Corynebacterium mendelii]